MQLTDTSNEGKYALIIGANGGIGQEVVKQMSELHTYSTIYTLSRSEARFDVVAGQRSSRVLHKVMDTADEVAVRNFINDLKIEGIKLSLVICTTGILHQETSQGSESDKVSLKPEKRLEDIHEQQLTEYFRINSILPAIWLQNLVKVLDKQSAKIVFFSARVGSISENALGGWYGYRASKAALNMLVKTAAIEYKRRAPNTSLLCYHPGTVDTGLSKPFQANVKPGKLFTPAFTVTQLLSICANLEAENSPFYLDWQGETIAW
ncbi:MAG: NAD(P)-dependent dehydrogenase (short-subunit alcohol dehydrogenase family) [Glaciecola sp.]|jgi:NAD(P)-dependent dehydrogenase (short-subunit alcohol dehydrogenase family)